MAIVLHTEYQDDDRIVQNEVLPVTFDLAFNGHITTSAFPLFRMPVELFAHVTRWLSKRDLQALALVDRDCCKLAALTLFKEVQVQLRHPLHSLSPVPSMVLKHNLSNSFPMPYHGSPSNFIDCVRQITIYATIQGGSAYAELDKNMTMSRDGYQAEILFPSAYTMPFERIFSPDFTNLHTLHWDGHPFLTSDVARCVNYPPLKHVHFRGRILDVENMASTFPSNVSRLSISNLETLSLDVWWHSYRLERKPIGFFQHLFQAIQSSLRRLTWKGFRGYITQDEILMSANAFDAPFFPNLRSVTLEGIAATDTTRIFGLMFNSDNPTGIRSLSMDTTTPSTRVFFNTRGYFPSLKHLCLINHDGGILTYPYEVFNFLNANHQLETLQFDIPTPHPTIDEVLLPLLRHDFKMLTSLQLTFDMVGRDGHIVGLESSLQGISSLTALRRLWLSAGGIRGIRSWNWNICHRDVVKFLAPLINLEVLAFSHDTYAVPNLHPLAPRNHYSRDYYLSKVLPMDVTRDMTRYLTEKEYHVYLADDWAYHDTRYDVEVALAQRHELTQLVWERWHLDCMLKVVRGCYAPSLRALQWCFVGQLAFSTMDSNTDVTRPGAGSQFTAERTRRDPNLALLRRKMAVDV